MKVVLITGGFDPIHSGHVDYINAAKELGNTLVVGLNSDAWLTRKKGRPFLPWTERSVVIANMHSVDRVINFNDDDGTAIDAIRKVQEIYPNRQIVFANGGDRTKDNIPEMVFDDVDFVFGVGGTDKKNSSSWILEEWSTPKTERPWGYYRIIHEVPGCKVKEITVNPGQSLSMQRHSLRSEYWIVTSGEALVSRSMASGYSLPPIHLKKHDRHDVYENDWHQLTNPFDEPCKIVEIQYGKECIEEDIQRR